MKSQTLELKIPAENLSWFFLWEKVGANFFLRAKVLTNYKRTPSLLLPNTICENICKGFGRRVFYELESAIVRDWTLLNGDEWHFVLEPR
jgi:hypothetical protein